MRDFHEGSSRDDGAWTDFAAHRKAEQRKFHGRRPKRIGNVLAQLVSRKGYAHVRASREQEQAWRSVIGPQLEPFTQFSVLKRGTFEVLVANSLMMQELTFQKEELLLRLQQALPDLKVKQLRFKIGQVTGKS